MWQRWLAVVAAVALATGSKATVYTVGAGGTHASLQEAVDAAFLNPGPDEVRLREGTLVGVTGVNGNLSNNDLTVSGGWDASYAGTGSAPTILDAAGMGSVLRVYPSGGNVQISRLSMHNGALPSQPVGIDVNATGFATVQIFQVDIADGIVTSGSAGCVGLNARDDSQVSLSQSRVHHCTSGSALPGSSGGTGIRVVTLDRGRVSLDDVKVDEHQTQASVQTTGTGISVNGSGQSNVDLHNVRIHGNSTTAPSVFGSGLALELAGSATATLSRLEVFDNLAPGAASTTSQLGLSASDFAAIRLVSSLLRDGPQSALSATSVGASARVHMHNLTIVQHAARGIAFFGPAGSLTLHNSIVQDNGLTSPLPVGGGDHNLGADLLLTPVSFSGPGDYRLPSGSPGVDAGTDAVPLGLAAMDFVGEPRVQGAASDIGAFERTVPLFTSGFE
ncbi:MAG: right-handed parallel beta-helix repeat-containing protein [Rhodanobacteraceae bacterium]|nr:right-handed parallel beta-helix repeat-containing protein [Rhodanobacteraceae bacterium]